MLKIAIVARYVDHQAGLGTYTRGLLGSLDRGPLASSIVVYTDRRPAWTGAGNLNWKVVPQSASGGNRYSQFRWDQVDVIRALRENPPDLVHWLHPTGSLLRSARRTLITVCDVNPWTLPAYRSDPKMRLYGLIERIAIKRADRLLTISEHSKKEISEVLKIPSSRITVTPLAADQVNTKPSPPKTIKGAYVLFLGGSEQRKNPTRTIRAFLKADLDPSVLLVVAGRIQQSPIDEDLNSLLASLPSLDRQRIVIAGMVSDYELRRLYAHATVFLYPSLGEGFGIPPLEAMIFGTPVITSNTTSLPEVVGSAALTVDPTNEAALKEAVEKVVNDHKTRDRLRAQGPEQAKRFSWAKTAERTAATYHDMI